MEEPTDFKAVLADVERRLAQHPDLAALRAIRDMLDDTAFIPQLAAYIRRQHNSVGLTEIPNRITGLMRLAEEGREDRQTTRDLSSTIAAGGGAALVVGSIIAALTLTVPAVALIPLFGGIWMGGVGYVAVRRTAQERVVFDQIAGRLRQISDELRGKP